MHAQEMHPSDEELCPDHSCRTVLSFGLQMQYAETETIRLILDPLRIGRKCDGEYDVWGSYNYAAICPPGSVDHGDDK